MPKPPMDAKYELALTKDMGQFFYDPTGFVRYAYPWRESGTALAEHDGPDEWHVEVMDRIGRELRTSETSVRVAITSGHGTGKSALMSWLTDWWMSTRPDSQTVATSNTRVQLLTKLWKELALWHSRSINEHWFDWAATSFKSVERPATWSANAIPNNPNNSEAFAGLHARDVLMLMDEASAIDEKIFQVVNGAMTTPGSLWVICGNPTRASGAFYDAFHSRRHRWITYQVNSMDAKMTNKKELQEWIDDYGAESDFCKVRIFGQFPVIGLRQLISTDDVERASHNKVEVLPGAGKVLALDVAREGDDKSVITMRHGRKVLPLIKFRNPDLMKVANRCAGYIDSWDPDTVAVDGGGLGGGVVDRLREMGYRNVIDVQNAKTADEPDKYRNVRAECWTRMRDWFASDVEIPDDPELKAQLTALEFWYNDKDQIQLERKKDLKKRLPEMGSPDEADSLAMTFAIPMRTHQLASSRSTRIQRPAVSRNSWRLM